MMTDSALYSDGTNIALDLIDLTTDEIVHAAWPVKFGRTARTRQSLFEDISKLEAKDQERIKDVAAGKRWSNGDSFASKKRRKCSDDECVVDANFLKPPSEDVVKSCIIRFIDQTNNHVLSSVTCIVCAREVAAVDAEDMSIVNIPNHQLLTPFEPHPAHMLTEGMLLHTSAIKHTQCNQHGFLCHECGTHLQKNQLPRLSLANGMWIGDIPFELSVLTLGEKVLIAKYFPAAYVVKLFPIGKGTKSTNKGLRGNVSTYCLNTNDIANMVTDNIFPRPSALLASVIAVTIVGRKDLPERSLPELLHVRRRRIYDALVWLKANNLLYANISISEDRLSQIRDGGIPEEILAGVRYSDDVELVERERAGYVPEEVETDNVEVGIDAGSTRHKHTV